MKDQESRLTPWENHGNSDPASSVRLEKSVEMVAATEAHAPGLDVRRDAGPRRPVCQFPARCDSAEPVPRP